MSERNPDDARVLYQAHFPALGRLASAAGMIEYYLAGMLADLVSPDVNAVSTEVLREVWSFASRKRLATRLLSVRLTDDHGAAELRSPIAGWLDDAAEIMKCRNSYLHSMWLGAVAKAHPIRLAHGGDHVEVPPEDLRVVADRAEQVAYEGSQLWERLAFLNGSFDALIEATRSMDPDWPDDK